jgi:hypothetical protein
MRGFITLRIGELARRTARALAGLYPALFGAFAVLSLYSSNFDELEPGDLVRPLLLAVGFGVALTAACQLLWRSREQGALVAAGTLIAFFSYGHLFESLSPLEVAGRSLGHHRYALAAIGLGWLAWLRWTGRRRRWPRALGPLLQAAAVVAGLVGAGGLLWRWRAAQAPLPASSLALEGEPGPIELPDIYYIVLDGYGRQDVLARYYGFDNSPFLDRLRSLGFYVADRSTANYNQTVLSLAASLNMQYVQDLIEGQAPGPEGRARLAETLKHSELRRYLERIGYDTLAFETGYSQTEIRDADVFWGPEADPSRSEHPLLGGRVSAFESLLLSTTAMRAVLDFDPLRRQLALDSLTDPHYEMHRARVRYTLDSLGKAAEHRGATFVFAHVISPHPPFVFDSEGRPLSNRGLYSLADADAFGATPEEYVALYRSQLEYLNTLVIPALEDILQRSDRPPVILLQADHGPGAYLVWDSLEGSLLKERMSVLNAYYFPDASYERLDPTISPVNSFRVVLSQYLGADLPRLPDRSFFSTWDQPLVMTDVTDQVR